jgi:hypothetical protein
MIVRGGWYRIITVCVRWYRIATGKILVLDTFGIGFRQQQSWCTGTRWPS